MLAMNLRFRTFRYIDPISICFRYGQTEFSIYILISAFDVISALQGVVIFCLIFLDNAMITKIKTHFGGMSSRFGESRRRPNISRQTTKLSLSQLTTINNRTSNDNDYVGVRFKNQQVSIDNNIGMDKVKQSVAASTISTVIVEGKIDDDSCN